MTTGEDGHSPPDQLYPIERVPHAFHLPQHRQHSFRTRLGHRPKVHHRSEFRSSSTHSLPWVCSNLLAKATILGRGRKCWDADLRESTLREDAARKNKGQLVTACICEHPGGKQGSSHQETGLPAGTIANDHEFAANFSHGDNLGYARQQRKYLRYERLSKVSRIDERGCEV